jgi:Flp pilus assembly protein CpaB
MAHISPKKTFKPFDWQKWLVVIGLGMIAALGAWYLYVRGPQPVPVVVPAHNLPMYHLIANNDLKKVSILPDEMPSEALRTESEMVGRYTREPLTADKTVLAKNLVPASDPGLKVNTSVVSIPATGAMTFANRLTSGDVVTLWNVPVNRSSTPELMLDQVLVLDVLPASATQTTTGEQLPYVVILAVPIDRQAEILSAAAKGSLMFTLHS